MKTDTASSSVTISRRYQFCASHRLHSNQLNDAENDRIYGKCNNPFGHGHDYVLSISVSGELDSKTGLLIHMGDLDCLIGTEIVENFNFRNLNSDVEEFKHLVPTTENLALVVAARLNKVWQRYFPYSSAWLSGISMQENGAQHF